jgi:hypothetical protein
VFRNDPRRCELLASAPVVAKREWELVVGSDVLHDEFFAEITYKGQQWASVVERAGRYFLMIHAPIEIEWDVALESLQEARRRVSRPQ